MLDRGQVPTPLHDGEAAILGRLIEVGREAIGRWPGVSSVGIGVPGLYDPAAGTARFFVNFPGGWHGTPVAGPVGGRSGSRSSSSTTPGRSASPSSGWARGAARVDGRADAGDRRRRRHRGRRAVHQGHDGTAGELGHQTIEPDGPWCGCGNRGCLESFARADQIAAACGTATAEEAVSRAAPATSGRATGWPRSGGIWGSGSRT